MTGQPRTCEANLLFGQTLDVEAIELDADLALVGEAYGLSIVELKTDTPAFRLFRLGDFQILVAGCAEPLDVTHFADAARPPGTTMPDSTVLGRLAAHRFSLTVLVSDEDDAGSDHPQGPHLKDRLCWQLTEALRARFRAPLVFWCANDTLYAGEEFAETGPFDADALSRPEPGVHRLDRQQMLAAKAMTYMQTQITNGAHRPGLTTKSRRLSRSLKAMALEPLDIARRFSRRLFSAVQAPKSTH